MTQQEIAVWITKIKSNPYLFCYCPVQIEQLCILAVSLCGDMLKYVNKQTNEMCIIAVHNDGYSLEHVENQTIEIVWEAYKQNKYSLKYAKPEFKKMVERRVKIDRLLENE